jgi:hypothetical protein
MNIDKKIMKNITKLNPEVHVIYTHIYIYTYVCVSEMEKNLASKISITQKELT